MLGKRPRPSTEEDISEQHWLSKFYEALLDVEHGRAEMEIREKSSRVYSKVELLVSERDKSLYPMCFAQKKPKINSNEKVQKIKQEVYEKFMKSKNIYDTTVSTSPDYLVEVILKNKSILTNVNSVLN